MQNQRQLISIVHKLKKELAIKNSELKIEAALEKVRSSCMAMQRSDDLQEVIKVIAEQFLVLRLRFDTANFGKVLPDGSWEAWISTPNQLYPARIFVPYFEHPAFADANKMYASGKDFFTWQYTREEKNSFFRYFFDNTAAKNISDERKKYVLNTKGWLRSVFILKNIEFVVACYDGIPYTNEENAVFRRFAKVFEQAYVRFLDLQKAEIHAKEAETAFQTLKSTQAQLIQSEKEKLSAQHIKQALELEAKALRAQMNPHFIFNCLNSIKALIQERKDEKAITYLTTFSKLIRTIFQNADKRQITLFDEIETCRLYTRLESMRFGSKFNYDFDVDETIDLKSIQVPALILQPFIENAIWHGIMPKEDGGRLHVFIKKQDKNVCCVIDDDGVGRKTSKQNKFRGDGILHESKGMRLTQNRLDLHNVLNENNASLQIVDKQDAKGRATGTTIIINFREE